MDWRVRKIELWVGALIGGATALLAALFIFGGGTFGSLADQLMLYTYMPRSHGLKPGIQVKILDFSAGLVRAVELQDNPQQTPAGDMALIRVAFSVDRKFAQFVRSDSTAKLKTTVIGEAFLEITTGSESAPPARDSDTIRFEPPDDVVAQIGGRVTKLLDAISDRQNTIGKALNDKGEFYDNILAILQNVEGITSELKKTMDSLNSPDGTVGAFLNDRRFYDEILKMQGQTKDMLAETTKLVTKLNEVLGHLSELTGQLPPVMKFGKDAAKDARDVVGSLKRIWPISSALGSPPEDELLGITPTIPR